MELTEIKTAVDTFTDAATKRFDELEKKFGGFVTDFEKLETAFKRPQMGGGERKDEPTIEQKAFDAFLRRGPDGVPADERKALIMGDDTAGGYLATPRTAGTPGAFLTGSKRAATSPSGTAPPTADGRSAGAIRSFMAGPISPSRTA